VPPLFRLDPKKGQSLRLVYTRSPLPKDRESLFWLNVLEVPPRDSSAGPDGSLNKLQLAIRTRIKVFFRPTGLSGSVDAAAAQVSWRFVSKKDGGYALEAANPTPYHVSFSRVDANAGGVRRSNEKGGMVAPGGSTTFDMGEVRTMPSGPLTVEYSFINDYGAAVKGASGPNPAS
jgi:chaperone protein EcpD